MVFAQNFTFTLVFFFVHLLVSTLVSIGFFDFLSRVFFQKVLPHPFIVRSTSSFFLFSQGKFFDLSCYIFKDVFTHVSMNLTFQNGINK